MYLVEQSHLAAFLVSGKGLVINHGEGGGGYKTEEGGGSEVLSPQKKEGGGAEQVLAMLKGAKHVLR